FMREKANVFFVFLLPFLIILLLGFAFGGGFDSKVGVYSQNDDALGASLTAALDDLNDLVVEIYDSEEALLDAVSRGMIQGGMVIPAGFSAALEAGGSAEVGFVARPDQQGQLLAATVQAVVQEEGNLIRAAQFAVSQGDGTFGEAFGTAAAVAPLAASVTVSYREAGGSSLSAELENLGMFEFGATQELVLFMFLTSLAGSAALIQTRKLGVARRMLSTPTSTTTILSGEVFGRFNVAFIQGIYIVVGTVLLFRVDWGDPLGALSLVVAFSLVGAAAGILMGAIFSNDQQAGGLGVLAGLGLAALGGAMAPIEIFPPAMQTVAKFTPHAWAIDGFAELVRRDGTFLDILPNLGVLGIFAAVFMVIGTWRLRRVLTR
ncbi:MAG: ABC transporter permease, partial [Acidimicrobiia bacterium]|nr:ABC transporter permease [Acidimicrobiia bacterium]